jgi:hypothetical protein
MAVKRTHLLQRVVMGLFILLCASGVQAATLSSKWICGTDNYSKATCWEPALAFSPYNRGTLTFSVNIPNGTGIVSMDVNVPGGLRTEVNSFLLGEGRTFRVPAGKCYSVKGQADIYGAIHGNGGDFIAPVAAFLGCKAQAWVDGGGYVEIGAPTYCATGLNANYTSYVVLSSDGAGSVLDLSRMTELDDGVSICCGVYNHTIAAQNGGVINLSGLSKIIGPTNDDILDVDVKAGGSIELDSLETVSAKGEDGRVRFNVDGNTILALPSLTSASSTEFHVTNGAKLDVGSSPFTYIATGLNDSYENYTLLSSDGVESVLDLSGMTELDDGVAICCGVYSHTIVAQNGGVIDLSRLTKIIGPREDDMLNLDVKGGGSINLDSLETVSAGGETGRVRINADGNTMLVLPSLTSAGSTEFHVTNGAKVDVGSTPFTYTATGLNDAYDSYTLLSSDGEGSVLGLSGMTELDDGVATCCGIYSHTISAKKGGMIDLSGLTKIIRPKEDDSLIIAADGGIIDMSSLRLIAGGAGTVAFNIDNGGQLILGDVNADKPVTIRLGDPNVFLTAVGDFRLGTTITIANPGHGTLALKGDFTHAHTDETKAPLQNSFVFFNGAGPQELEVACLDMDDLWEELPEYNFGFGQMMVGGPNEPAVVFLTDRIDNGNRGGLTGYEEALYLFGNVDPNDQNGLHLLGGSTLYMGGLPVYTLVNGVRTDLRTLFGPNDVTIPFDHGYLCLGKPNVSDPRNLVCNGGFETGKNPPIDANCVVTLPEKSEDVDCWVVAQNSIGWTHEACFVDAGDGERFADLSSRTPSPQGSTEGQTQAVSQVIQTMPGKLYQVWFDVAVNPCGPAKGDTGKRSLKVSAAGASEKFVFDSVAQVNWQTRTWRFTATDAMTILTFTGQDEPTTGCGVAIDNVIVFGPANPTCTLSLSVQRGGSVAALSEDGDQEVLPGETELPLKCGQQVTLVAKPDPGYLFGGWKGLEPDDIKDGDADSNAVTVVMSRNIRVSASFHDLIVKITDIDTSSYPTMHATVMVTRTDGNAVEGLDRWNFNVYEMDGLQRSIEVGPRTSCVAVSLVLDYSGSMDVCNAVPPMEDAAIWLVNQMPPQDLGEIIKFARGIKTAQEYTVKKDDLINAIRSRPTGVSPEGTLLYDAICGAISDASQQSCDMKAIVVLTDGMDTGSQECDVNGIIDGARREGIRIFTIGLECEVIDEPVLMRIANETGGMYYHAPGPDELKEIYQKISKTINNQYLVSYEAWKCPGGVGDHKHSLRIEVVVDESTGEDEEWFLIPKSYPN